MATKKNPLKDDNNVEQTAKGEAVAGPEATAEGDTSQALRKAEQEAPEARGDQATAKDAKGASADEEGFAKPGWSPGADTLNPAFVSDNQGSQDSQDDTNDG